MKNTTIKNVLFILSGMMIAASASIFAAQNTTTIEANLVNLRQYLKELYITSTGTPAGDVVMHIDGSGRMIQYRQQDDVEYYLLNTDQLGNPHAGAIAVSGQYSYVNAIQNIVGGPGLMSVIGAVDSVSNTVAFAAAKPEGVSLNYVYQIGADDADNEILVDANGIQFSFSGVGNYYKFPMTVGLPSQVLATDGTSQLYWTDVGDGGGFSLGVTSINGATGAVFLTTDDIEEGNNNQFIYTKRFQLSSAQVLDLHNTPIQVIDAPGAGKMVTIVDVFGRIQPGATPYTLNSFPNVSLYYQDQPIENGYKTNFDFLANTTEFVQAMSPGCFGNCASDMNNKPLFIGMEPGGSVTDGDGSVDVYVSYKILDLEMTAE